jgi:hypothetical protein
MYHYSKKDFIECFFIQFSRSPKLASKKIGDSVVFLTVVSLTNQISITPIKYERFTHSPIQL